MRAGVWSRRTLLGVGLGTVGGLALLLAGLVGVLPLAAPRTDVVLLDTEVSWLVPILGLSVLAAAFAYVAGISGARRLGAKVASFVGLTEVLFAVLFAWAALGQQPGPVQGIGAAVVLGGIVLVKLGERPADEPLAVEPVPAGQS